MNNTNSSVGSKHDPKAICEAFRKKRDEYVGASDISVLSLGSYPSNDIGVQILKYYAKHYYGYHVDMGGAYLLVIAIDVEAFDKHEKQR